MLRYCGNGSSEMLSSAPASITGILYNLQLMKYAREDGVAIGFASWIASIFVGYDETLVDTTSHALLVFSIPVLFM